MNDREGIGIAVCCVIATCVVMGVPLTILHFLGNFTLSMLVVSLAIDVIFLLWFVPYTSDKVIPRWANAKPRDVVAPSLSTLRNYEYGDESGRRIGRER